MFKNISTLFVLVFVAHPLFAQQIVYGDDYAGYEGLVLGERNSRSATATVTARAKQEQLPGDIYRGTVFGAEQKKYASTTLGNRPRATTKMLYDTSLIHAIKIGDEDRVKTLLYAHIDANEKNYAGLTPLTVAAEKGNLNIVKQLVENGKADVNEKSSYGVTPLIAAAAAGNNDILDYLIEKGADANGADDLGKTALLYASSFDEDAKAVVKLIELNPSAINTPDYAGNTPLIFAAQHGAIKNVKTLMAHRADVNYRNPNTGLTALAAAAAEGHDEVIRTLVKTGKANPNAVDFAGRTPLLYAIEQDQAGAARALLVLGANPNASDANGTTPLMRAAAKNRTLTVTYLLRQKDIQPEARDNQGRTALHYSAYAQDADPAQKLLAAHVNVNAKDLAGNTPLMHALQAKNDVTASYFMKMGADPTVRNITGETPSSLATTNLPTSAAAELLGVRTVAPAVQTTAVQQPLNQPVQRTITTVQHTVTTTQTSAANTQAAAQANLQAAQTNINAQVAAAQAKANTIRQKARDKQQGSSKQAQQIQTNLQNSRAAAQARVAQAQAAANANIQAAKKQAYTNVQATKTTYTNTYNNAQNNLQQTRSAAYQQVNNTNAQLHQAAQQTQAEINTWLN